MEHDNKDVSEAIRQAATELYKLTILAEGRRIRYSTENKVNKDFSFRATYFKQAKKHLT